MRSDTGRGRDFWLGVLEPPQVVPSAVLYGIDTWEVAHNRFMHWVLTDPGWGLPLIRALVGRAIPTLGEIEAVERARDQVERPVQLGARAQNGRLDEEVWLRLGSGERVALVIEMKLDALAGARQLLRYVDATRRVERRGADAGLPTRVEGLLLRLTSIPDPAAVDGIGRMNLAGYVSALDAMLDGPTPADARVTRAQLADYRCLCRWLDTREQAVLDAPWQALGHAHGEEDTSLGRHGAFVRRLIAGAIADALAKADGSGSGAGVVPDTFDDRFAWLGPKIATDRDSAFLDCAVGVRRPLRTVVAGGMCEPRSGPPEAVGFIKVRVKPAAVRVELHTIITDYPKNKAQIPSRRALTQAWIGSAESNGLVGAGWRRVAETKDGASRCIQRFDLPAGSRGHQTAQEMASEVAEHVGALIASVSAWRSR